MKKQNSCSINKKIDSKDSTDSRYKPFKSILNSTDANHT